LNNSEGAAKKWSTNKKEQRAEYFKGHFLKVAEMSDY